MRTPLTMAALDVSDISSYISFIVLMKIGSHIGEVLGGAGRGGSIFGF
jgi:hypothetical protein